MPSKQSKHAPKHPTQPMFEVSVEQITKAEIRMMSTIEDAMHTIAFMTEYCREHGDNDLKELTIADAFACLGGNTLSFCRTFKHVRAYEIVKDRFAKLQDYTAAFENILLFNQNCRHDNGILDSRFPRDVIFLDPPWENPETHEVDDSVFTDAIDMCNQISQQTTTKYVFMKLPLQLSDKVDNRANFKYLTEQMNDDWTDIRIQPLLRWKNTRYEETYTIVCACRKQKPIEDTPAMTTEAPSVQLLLMQLANLHA